VEQQVECGHSQHAKNKKKLGDVTTLNLTMLRCGVTLDGGLKYMLNVVPALAEAGFDVRLPVTTSVNQFIEQVLEPIASQFRLKYEFLVRSEVMPPSSTDPLENPFWASILRAFKEAGIDVDEEIFPAATDSKFLRQLKIPCFGFSPMNRTPILLHDHNERLNRKTYFDGISIYEKLLTALANT